MINPKLVVVTLLILIGGSIIGANNIFAQDSTKTKTYEFSSFGDVYIRFQYPSNWTVADPYGQCISPCTLAIYVNNKTEDITGISFTIEMVSLNTLDPPVTTLKDFASNQYEFIYRLNKFTSDIPLDLINDNKTIIGNNHPAIQMEYIYPQVDDLRHALNIWAIDKDRDKGYTFSYSTKEGPEFAANIPSIRKILDSIEFIPIEPPREEPPREKLSFID